MANREGYTCPMAPDLAEATRHEHNATVEAVQCAQARAVHLVRSRTCLDCRHQRPALSGNGIIWPCLLGNMPAKSGRCVKWNEGG